MWREFSFAYENVLAKKLLSHKLAATISCKFRNNITLYYRLLSRLDQKALKALGSHNSSMLNWESSGKFNIPYTPQGRSTIILVTSTGCTKTHVFPLNYKCTDSQMKLAVAVFLSKKIWLIANFLSWYLRSIKKLACEIKINN